MRMLAERGWFLVSLALGRLLRSARYSSVRIVRQGGERQVRKRRSFYAPLLIRLGDPVVTLLETGVRVLPGREWEERERRLYLSLYGTSVRRDDDGTLVLPYLEGETLAAVLEKPEADESPRRTAIQLAVASLAEMHRLGFTHGDAMAENVLVDLEAGVAQWFDFETLHDSSRPVAWSRADDVRALLASCLLRTPPDQRAGTLELIVETYGDQEVTRLLVTSFSVLQRSLAFHLGQAGLSFRDFTEIARLLSERSSESGASR